MSLPDDVRVALSRATQALQTAQSQGLPLTAPLVDKSPVGSFWCRVGVAIGTGATNVVIQLTRNPSVFIANTNNGAVVYQTAGDVAASTAALFVCRATAATTATLLVG